VGKFTPKKFYEIDSINEGEKRFITLDAVRLYRSLLRPGASPVRAEISASHNGSTHRILQPEDPSGRGGGRRGVVPPDAAGVRRRRKGKKPQITLLTTGRYRFIILLSCRTVFHKERKNI
jgi:hypothetical protein